MADASESANGGVGSVSSRAGIKPRGNLARYSAVRVSPAIGFMVKNSNGVFFIFSNQATERVGCEP